MAKEFNSISAFVGKPIVLEYIKSGSEEITGTVKYNKDGVITLVQEFRGATFTYRIPATEVVYVKASEETEIAKGSQVTLERQINKIIKIKATLIGADDHGVIVDRGEVRGRLVKTFVAYSKIDSLTYAELTAEGAKASKAKSERMKAGKKSGKKLKVVEGKKSKKAA